MTRHTALPVSRRGIKAPKRIKSFGPLCGPRPTALILGSMPGAASLAKGQYYAHPQNAFWPIMGMIHGFPEGDDYRTRAKALAHAGVALWDALQSCERAGSLDASIVDETAVPNEIGGFLDRHPTIARIGFNGAKAEQAFAKRILWTLSEKAARIPRVRLPSTSPAHASMTREAKRQAWAAFFEMQK